MIENGIYRTPFGKERIITDPRMAYEQSQARRNYFTEIKPLLFDEIVAFVPRVADLTLIGSVLYNASDYLSDIDILVLFNNRLTYNEHTALFTIVPTLQTQHNLICQYNLDFYYKEPPYPLSLLDNHRYKHEAPSYDRFIHRI